MPVQDRIKDYSQLLKPNLSFMVVFSSVIGYLLAPHTQFAWKEVSVLFLGGILVTGGANTINQIIEREGDALMKRTMNRPIPTGRISTTEAWILAAIAGISGALLLGLYFNPLAGALSFLSYLLYAFAYTPMKRVHPIAVFIGAFPGAFPPLLGWVAATGSIGVGGIVLFLFQFFWQFPHYWAIGWVGYDEYKKAGISMLPSQERTSKFTALQCMFYSLILIPMAIVPRTLNITGNIGMYVCIAAGIFYFASSVAFYRKNDLQTARRVMFSSFIYLPTVLLALLFDKL
ncbi:protoheme IX farnesyltransferase [Taibaiella soli]|uniref:Protoheme IX farnesyltransferase n=2 Tax=Taibaiella soli TaxID=1649169 RepID=A0A2W2C3H4_9BACT|nr:protoheme IX farnesyltransferase [Taibaiella soli]